MSLDLNLRFIAACAVLIGASTAVTSCASTHLSVGLESVDSLTSQVDQLQVEMELSKQAVSAAITSVGPLFTHDFSGDVSEAFEIFAKATNAAKMHATKLRAQIEPLRASATGVFKRWEASLRRLSDDAVRQRSAERLDVNRERFDQVQETSVLALKEFDALNRQLRDTVLFLGHDFNMTAVAEIEGDAGMICDEAKELSAVFDAAENASAEYVALYESANRWGGKADGTVLDE